MDNEKEKIENQMKFAYEDLSDRLNWLLNLKI